MTSNTNSASQCTVTLFHVDNRVENKERLNTVVMNFSNKEAAKRISDIVSAHFGLQEMLDKKFVGSFFMSSYIPTEYCELNLNENPISFGIEVKGERSFVHSVEYQKYEPIKRQEYQLFYCYRTEAGTTQCKLTYEDVMGTPDVSTVALYNSPSFKGFYQRSIEACRDRYLEKTN